MTFYNAAGYHITYIPPHKTVHSKKVRSSKFIWEHTTEKCTKCRKMGNTTTNTQAMIANHRVSLPFHQLPDDLWLNRQLLFHLFFLFSSNLFIFSSSARHITKIIEDAERRHRISCCADVMFFLFHIIIYVQ